MYLYLRLDQQTAAGHFLRLLDAHGSEEGGRNIAQDALLLLEAPALRGVGQDEGNPVGSVGGLGGSFFVDHLLGVSAVSSATYSEIGSKLTHGRQ